MQTRGVLMAGNLATKQINNTGWDFCRYNGEFALHTVDWGFHPNNKNVVAPQNFCGCENWDCEHTVVTPASYGAQTLVLSGFQGGGGNP